MSEDKWEVARKKVEATGKKIQQVGCALTLLITIPVVLTV
jgi:hypothetical protein